MNIQHTIDCDGLSIAPTILRIKQALTGRSSSELPLGVVISSECDKRRLEASLGDACDDIHLLSEPPSLDNRSNSAQINHQAL